MSQEWTSCFLEGPYWKRGQVLLLRLHFFKKKVTPSNFISVACLQRRLFSQIHESGKEAMASTARPFRKGGQKDVFSILASVFAFSRASFGNSVETIYSTVSLITFFANHHGIRNCKKKNIIYELSATN